MTTIAYRDGVIAADTGSAKGGSQIAHATKIVRNTNGDLAAAAGEAGLTAAFRAWFAAGEDGDPPKIGREGNGDLGTFVIFRRSGEIEMFESSGRFEVRAPYFALGSGRCEALGAMWMGATAEQAVQAAISLDEGTYGNVETLHHEQSRVVLINDRVVTA